MQFHNAQYLVGEQADAAPTPEQFEPGPFRKSRPPEPLHFEVNLVAEAHSKQQKTGTVQVNIPGFSPVTLYCDEQPPVGDDRAPPPLARAHRDLIDRSLDARGNPWAAPTGSPATSLDTAAEWEASGTRAAASLRECRQTTIPRDANMAWPAPRLLRRPPLGRSACGASRYHIIVAPAADTSSAIRTDERHPS